MKILQRKLGTVIIAGLFLPTGLALAQTAPTSTLRAANSASSTARTATTSSKNTFSRIQDLAQNVQTEVGPLKFGTEGTSTTWRLHSKRLATVKRKVDRIEQDVSQLESRKATLPSWQQQLLGNVKQDSHELVYQTSAAIKALNAHHDTAALATTQYPHYIDAISQKANDAASSIGSVFQQHGVDID